MVRRDITQSPRALIPMDNPQVSAPTLLRLAQTRTILRSRPQRLLPRPAVTGVICLTLPSATALPEGTMEVTTVTTMETIMGMAMGNSMDRMTEITGVISAMALAETTMATASTGMMGEMLATELARRALHAQAQSTQTRRLRKEIRSV